MAPVGAQIGNPADPIVTALVEQDKIPWYKKKNLRYLYLIMFPTCIGIEMTSGFDSSMMNGLQAVQNWDEYFDFPRGSRLGIFSASYSLGAIVGLPFIPMISHRWGRRWTIIFGSVIMIIGAVIQGASQNFAMFTISRIILGFGIPYGIVGASALIGETAYPKERATLTAVFNASWFIGAIVAASITLGTFAMPNTWSWRIPSFLQVVPSLLQIVFMPWMPESPRFLIQKDRIEEARDFFIKYHAEGNADSELVKAEIVQVQTAIKLELEHAKLGWRELFRTPGNRRRATITGFLGLFTQWSGNTLISYYLVQILNQAGITKKSTQTRINLGRTCWDFLNGTIIALNVPRLLKRRTGYFICTIGLLCVYISWTISASQYAQTKHQSAGYAVLVMIFLYSPFYNVGYNSLTYTYLVELFPYHIRTNGIAFFQVFGRAAGFFNNFVNPVALEAIAWRYYITYCVWLGFEIIFVYFMFPETSGRTLEELAFLFEGSENNDLLSKTTEKQLGDNIHLDDVPVVGGQKDEERPTIQEIEATVR
ncbi:hypothetical protein TWF102_003654 [Orbilia oligospora]|uniref:Major facilitator superfamily (MFS) profile domain-containing protein n=1 Tax=Orbilia oligospora TaxID=2813651 RepID=A0A7C8JC18_ORBOL|nr:hypothetical protein TWF103_011794 [Orbilia oligospora]KAF3103463.1 hypothetical protein TWF102_003654 [Orbilia oligospora]